MADPTLVALLGFTAAAAVLTITPGLDTALVLRSAATGGARGGMRAGLGICGGLLVWGAGAAVGLNALLAASEAAFTALKWAGAAYLVYLGVTLILKPRRAFAATGAAAGPATGAATPGADHALRTGFLTNILNPKVGVFYVSFLPAFIPAGAAVAPFSMLLASVHVALTLVWFAILIALTAPLGRALAHPAVITTLDRLTGGVFVAFGAKLALTART